MENGCYPWRSWLLAKMSILGYFEFCNSIPSNSDVKLADTDRLLVTDIVKKILFSTLLEKPQIHERTIQIFDRGQQIIQHLLVRRFNRPLLRLGLLFRS